MTNESFLTLAVLVPVVGALLFPLVAKGAPAVRELLAFGLVAVSLACSLALAPFAFDGVPVTVRINLPLSLNFVLYADGLAVFMAVVSSFISAIIILYSFDYIRHYGFQTEYYFMVVLFLGSMMGLVFSGNLILLYVFWELTAITSWRLIGFFREPHQVLRADKAFMVTAFGALAMLLGFIMIYTQTGTFDLAGSKAVLNGAELPGLAIFLIMLGILSKSATLPFHTWLPDAGVAPSPVTALLHAAVLVKIGVYVFARLFVATYAIGDWNTAVLIIAAVSALVSAGAALLDTDLKRIIAFSTVSQIAFIFLGFASGTQVGVAGALLYILMHGLAKGGLFLCAGIVEQNTHTKDITKLGGLAKTMPITALAFLFCAVSVMGVPPFGGFFSKYLVVNGAVQGGHPWLAAVFVVGAFMTILYLFRVFNLVFMGEQKWPKARELSPAMVACVALLAVLSLAGGILINIPAEFARCAAQQMMGMIP